MMRSLFSGVSGLKVHQQKMDIIGNNIANVNTVAYKSSRVTFSDILSQTISGATSADTSTGRGGSNPMQIGLGVNISSVDTITTGGSTETTGNTTDLSISGNGFFIVRNGSNSTYEFTRAGNFTVDKMGNLVTSDGMNVYGWLDYGGVKQSDGTYEFDTDKTVEAINIYSDDYSGNKKIISAKATENATFTGNLCSSEEALGTDLTTISDTAEAQFTSTMTVYDSLGNEYEIEVEFTKCYVGSDDDGNAITTWRWQIPDTSDLTMDSGNSGFIAFDSDSDIVTDDTSYPATSQLVISPGSTVGSNDLTINIDFSTLNMNSNDSSVETSSVDGYTSGTLSEYSIGSDGIIMGVYSNGKQQPLGMIALASFANPSGLLRSGSNNYIATANSGDFINGSAVGSDGTGTLTSGALEMSNVDLSNEFSQLIITQRGFQANSRVITASDEMLQELVNLKR
ncbi:MAG: flagellar hook protein FlgE [Clostridiaceae bacterium]|nr:flagellar hook protein FlgE [Clostridiaceae bacterium]